MTKGLRGFAYFYISSVAFPFVKSKLYEVEIYNPADYVDPIYSTLNGSLFSIDKEKAKADGFETFDI